MSERTATRSRRFDVSERLAEPAEAWLAGAADEVAPPRLASSVMLVRDARGGGVEVFTIRRVSTMSFAPDMTAFPGGGVDERDSDHDLPWAGPEPREWARRIGRDEDLARQLVVAAAREVFEECGVLLAGSGAGEVVADLTGPEWDDERDRLLSREQSFAELLIGRDLVLRTDLLAVRAHWITPEFEPLRYDTLFFAARPPRGQTPDDRTGEAVRVEWARPADRLAAAERGELMLMPPTRVMLEDLAAAAGTAEVMAPGPPPVTVLPALIRDDDGRPVLEGHLPVAVREAR